MAAPFDRGSEAVAQIDPDDAGSGEKLGLGARHGSGQVGTVTLFRRGPQHTLVVITLFSEPRGREEPARIGRGRACERAPGSAAYALAPVVNGFSRTLLTVPEAKLLSGNYVVAVASPQALRHDLACGPLYR